MRKLKSLGSEFKQSNVITSSGGVYFSKRSSRIGITLVAIAIAVTGTYLLIGSHAASAATLYVSPSGTDGSNTCTQQSSPCASFNQAYKQAAPGDTVQVAGGVYNGTQTIAWDSTKASATSNVTFQPASGATVNVVGNIVVQSSHVTFKDMQLVDPNNSNSKFDVEADTYPLGTNPSSFNDVGFITFQNITGRNFQVSGAHDVSILGGSYGPASACGSGKPNLTQYGGGNNALRTADPAGGAHVDPNNILIDGVTVHNIMSYDLVGCHTEGVAIFSGSNVTIRNSKFYGNDVYDVLAQANSGSSALGQITLENNWFGPSTNSGGTGSGSNGVEFDDNKNIRVTNNSFNDGLLFLAGPSFTNVSIVGNIVIGPVFAASSNGSMCGASGVTAQYNITQGLAGLHCTTSTNSEVSSVSSFYVNPSGDSSLNYGLKSGSSAINLVPTSASSVTNDIDYHCRPAAGQTNIDAGASELGATGSCGNPITGGGSPPPPPPDTTPPTVSVTAPASGATVSGSSVTVSADAADNVGVASVQFQLDGNNLGSLDTGTPYATTWDTTGTANGTHTLTAIAKDAAGNTTTSSSVTVTVNNTSGGGGGTAGCTTTVSTASALTSAVSSTANGDTICVNGGSYGAMTWNGGTSRTSKAIVKPTDSTPVTFTGTLTINGAEVEVQNISLAGQLYQINGPAHDIQMTNVTAGHFIIEANGTSVAQNITLKGGSIGPWSSYPDNWIVSGGGSSPNKNIMIDGVTIHDFTIASTQLSTTHFECLQVWAVDGLTVQNSTFKNCSVFDMFIQAAGSGQPPAPTNVLIQNNFLDCCTYSDIGYSPNFAIQLPTDHGEGTWKNITIRNNSGDDGYLIGSGPAATFTNDIIENNIAPNLNFDLPSSPPSGLKTDYNLWYSGSKVGTHDLTNVTTASLFIDFAGRDFHLKSGAPAIGKADPTSGSYPTTDIDGNPRPAANGPDIGANEPPAGSTETTPPTVSITAPTDGSTVGGTVSAAATASDASGVSKVEFYVDGSSTPAVTDTTSPYTFSWDTTSLDPNITHTLVAKAYDVFNNTNTSTVTVHVQQPDNTPPSAPTNVQATATSPTAVHLTWTAATDNTGVSGYLVYRYLVCGGSVTTGCGPNSAAVLNTTLVSGTSYNDSGLSANTAYGYIVKAEDAAGNLSAASSVTANSVVTTPNPPDTTPPSTPTNVTATLASSSQVNLSWTASTDNVAVAGYNVYRNGSTTPLNGANLVTTTSYGDGTVSAGNTYTYQLEAVDGAGNKSAKSTVTSSTTVTIGSGGQGTACTTTVSSVSAAQTAVTNAASGDTVCMAAGSYGSITLTGNHTANVTFEPDPSLNPNGAGKVTFAGINIAGNYITVHNFYSTGTIGVGSASPYPGYNHDVIDHNAIGPTSGYGIDVLSSASTPSSFITISNNIIHDTSATNEGDALRLDGWNNVTVTGNDIYNIKECAGDLCHTDTLQSYNENVATSNLTITKNYIHDTDRAQGFPFLKDGDISNVTISDNLALRMGSDNQVTGIWVDENIAGLKISNNTYQSTSGSLIKAEGSAANPSATVTNNVFDSFQNGNYSAPLLQYPLTESNNMIKDRRNLPNNAADSTAAPVFMNTATDDYRLTSSSSNLAGAGIDWAPADQQYGPVDTSGSGGGDTTAPTVSITAPANNASVSGTTTVTATASDNVGVASVQFKLDGANLGAPDTTSPYSTSWNTTTATSGTHILTAVATDGAGNTTTATNVTVTVNNCTTGTLAAPTGLAQKQLTTTYTAIGLQWTAPAPTPGCTISGYNVYRNGSSTPANGGTLISATSYTDTGLTAGSTYSYTVQAVDSGPNTSAKSSAVNATTTADNLAPSVPGSITATAVNPSQVNLSWSASTDNPNPGGVGVKGYNIYRNNSTTPLNATPIVGTSYSDSTVSASTSYTYVVTAVDNASNESAPSSIANATTPAPTCSGSPTTPGTPTKTAATVTSISFNWTASTASAGCTLSGYHVYRADVSATNPIATVSSGTSYTDSNLTPNTLYTYTVKAFDTSSHSSSGASNGIATQADTTAPSAPGSVTATAVSSGQVNLTWAASTDNVGVSGYKVYRAGTLITTVNASTLTYSDTTVAANTNYTYQVSAIDAASPVNESAKTTASPNPVHTPAATDTVPPSAPTGLAAPTVASQSATLIWNASTDNVAVAGYHVYLNGVYDADTLTNSFTASCIAPNVSYTVTVKAFDSAGNTSSTATANFTSIGGGLSGDVNCDHVVNATDLLFGMLPNWYNSVNNTPLVLPTGGDVTGDTKVTSTDLFDLLRNWGKSI